MARQGGNRRRSARVALFGVAVAGVSFVAAPAFAEASAEPAVVAPGPAPVEQHSLGPVSTAAIGGVLVAGALWLRARQRTSVTA